MMKKLLLIAAASLLAGSVFAQEPGSGRGWGPMAPFEWKLGTVVTTEYKKVSGVVTINTNAPATVKVEGTDFLLLVHPRALTEVKTGDVLMIEGTLSTVKSDSKVQPFIHPFKLSANGKEIPVGMGRGPKRGQDDDDGAGFGRGPGPRP